MLNKRIIDIILIVSIILVIFSFLFIYFEFYYYKLGCDYLEGEYSFDLKRLNHLCDDQLYYNSFGSWKRNFNVSLNLSDFLK